MWVVLAVVVVLTIVALIVLRLRDRPEVPQPLTPEEKERVEHFIHDSER